MHGYIDIVVAVRIAVEKMFPGKINAIRRYVPNIEFIITLHMIGIGQDIDILKIRKQVIL